MSKEALMADKNEFQEIIKSFHLMWDHFPEPVQLAHKTYEIIAVNPACAIIGREVGMKCIKQGAPENHKGCLAQRTIAEHKTKYVKNKRGDNNMVVYWLPVDGHPDLYIHFGIFVTMTYD